MVETFHQFRFDSTKITTTSLKIQEQTTENGEGRIRPEEIGNGVSQNENRLSEISVFLGVVRIKLERLILSISHRDLANMSHNDWPD